MINSILAIAGSLFIVGSIAADDVAAIAAEGFVAVIYNRPDGEEPGQPTAALDNDHRSFGKRAPEFPHTTDPAIIVP